MFKGWMKSSSKTIQMKATRVAPAKLRVCCRHTKEKKLCCKYDSVVASRDNVVYS